jgi:hypothetical protein
VSTRCGTNAASDFSRGAIGAVVHDVSTSVAKHSEAQRTKNDCKRRVIMKMNPVY